MRETPEDLLALDRKVRDLSASLVEVRDAADKAGILGESGGYRQLTDAASTLVDARGKIKGRMEKARMRLSEAIHRLEEEGSS